MLKLLERPPADVDVEAFVSECMREFRAGERRAAAVALVISFEDGSQASAFEGSQRAPLVGALEWLKARVLADWL